MVEAQKKTLESFGVVFDRWFYESELHEAGEVKEALSIVEKNGHIREEDGARWFKTTKFGDDKDRVVIKQDGEYTYFASDIAYMRNKLEKRGAETIINIMGPDHHGYIKRLEAIIQALGRGLEGLEVLILQQVNLLEGGEKVKMSKRAGKIVTLDGLMEEVGKDAARFFFVMRNYNSHLDFDISLAKEQSDKNPVYYVQYAYARVCNIFGHASEKGAETGPEKNFAAADFSELNEEEAGLVTSVLDIGDVMTEAAVKRSPSLLVQALNGLVSSFHSFYNMHRVVGGGREAERLFILSALKVALEECFEILGITKRERM